MMNFIILVVFTFCIPSFAYAQASLPPLSIHVDHSIQDEGEYLLDSPVSISMHIDGSYVIAEQRQSKVFVFSPDHRLIQTLGQKGNGPGEFQMLSHIALIGDRLVAFDRQLMRVTIINVTSGNVVSTRSYRDFFNSNLQPLHVSVVHIAGKSVLSVVTVNYTFSGADADVDFIRWYDDDLNPVTETNYRLNLDHDRLFVSNQHILKANFFSPNNNVSTFFSNSRFYVLPHIYEGKLQGFSTTTGEYIDYLEPFRSISKPPFREFESRDAMQNDVEGNNYKYKYVSQSGSKGTIRVRIESYSLGIVQKDDKLYHIVGIESDEGYDYKYTRYNAQTGAYEGSGDVEFGSPNSSSRTKPLIHQVFPSNKDSSFAAFVLVDRQPNWVIYQF